MCLHLFLFNLPSFSSSFNFSCHHDEYYALLQFKSSFTIGASYFMDETYIPKTTTWNNKTNCCSWQGVTCDIISGHVTAINLFGESLQDMWKLFLLFSRSFYIWWFYESYISWFVFLLLFMLLICRWSSYSNFTPFQIRIT